MIGLALTLGVRAQFEDTRSRLFGQDDTSREFRFSGKIFAGEAGSYS